MNINKFISTLSIKYSWPIIGLTLLFFTAISYQLIHLRIDNTMLSFLAADDPVVSEYQEFHKNFGSDEHIIIGIEANDPFSPEFIDFLYSFQNQIEETVPYIKSVDSYLSARRIRHADDELIVDSIIDDYPLKESDFQRLRKDTLDNKTYKNLYINEEADFIAIHIKPLTASAKSGSLVLDTEQKKAIYDAIYAVINKQQNQNTTFYVNGSPILQYEVVRGYAAEMGIYYGACYFIFMIVLYLIFKRISGVLLPLLIAQLSVMAAMGFMATFDMTLTSVTQILPAFILIAGVGDAIHILTLFYQQLDKGNDKTLAIKHCISHSGPPVLFTSLTTAGGLIAFTFSDLHPINNFGWAAVAGIMVAFYLSVLFLPSLLYVLPIKKHKKTNKTRIQKGIAKKINHTGRFSLSQNKWVLFFTLLISVIAIDGISKLRFSLDLLEYFEEGYEFRTSSETLNKKLKGINNLEFFISANENIDFKDPQTLKNIDRIIENLKKQEINQLTAAQAVSLTTVIKEIHQAMHDGDASYYAIPNSRELIAQYILLFEMSGSSDLEELISSDFKTLRISILLPITDSSLYLDYINIVQSKLKESISPAFTITATGMVNLQGRVFSGIVDSTLESYAIAILILSILMFIFIGDFKLGLISMLPNLLPVYLMLATMGWLDIPIELGSVILGSVALGLAVDDTIHFMHNFKRYYREHGDYEKAVQQTLATAGNAMMFTSLMIFCGYSVFMLSSLNAIKNFGMMNMNAAAFALAADLIVAPALIAFFYKKKVSLPLATAATK